MATNRIDMTVGLKVDKSGLNQLKKSLQDIQNLTTRDLMNINGNNFNKAKEDLKTIKSQAEKVEAALKQAFNPKLGTVNVETFNNVLKKSSGYIAWHGGSQLPNQESNHTPCIGSAES